MNIEHYNKRVEAAALAIARRRGHGGMNREHPLWEYYTQDAKDALAAAATADTPEFNRQMDEIGAWMRSLPDHAWQPIKTAPIGGPPILGLLIVEDMHHHVIVRWNGAAWLDEYDNEHCPDYWQTLPEPPENNALTSA